MHSYGCSTLFLYFNTHIRNVYATHSVVQLHVLLIPFVTGMTVLAQTYREDEARSKAMGIALGGVALGVLGR